ncbi:MAG: thiamine phosphate synthase [Chlorobiaceae bacterium]|nr:thiamine phosphate synthase [Chlorobiaceae bacterium]NTV60517.1 thiamine phosphate synthase [Chlorobiaceae bacterium]
MVTKLPRIPFLCVITDESISAVSLAEEALRGGAAMIQLRHKTASGMELFAWAQEIRKLCRKYGALFFVNDRLDIAMACGADGVHLGQEDIPARAARKIAGGKLLIGISATSVDEALKAQEEGADYIGLGHIFPTMSKEKHHPPLGVEALAAAASLLSVPIVAIGGITLENAPVLVAAGATGIAVISAVSRAPSPHEAARDLAKAINPDS